MCVYVYVHAYFVCVNIRAIAAWFLLLTFPPPRRIHTPITITTNTHTEALGDTHSHAHEHAHATAQSHAHDEGCSTGAFLKTPKCEVTLHACVFGSSSNKVTVFFFFFFFLLTALSRAMRV